MKYI
jgi:hypothetical protein